MVKDDAYLNEDADKPPQEARRAGDAPALEAGSLARIELVAVDLDGTLVGGDDGHGAGPAEAEPEGAVSGQVAAGLRRAASAGLRLTLATGRMYRSAVQIAGQLGLDVPLITYNGGLIKRPGVPEAIGFFPLGRNVAREALAYVSANPGTQAFVYVADNLLVEEMTREVEAYCERCRVSACVVPGWDSILAPELSGRSLEAKPRALEPAEARGSFESEVIKVLIVVEELEEVPRHAGALKASFEGRARVANSMPTYIEVCSMEASKARALMLVARALGLRRDQVAAIGDSENDIEMVACAGLGIAVGNASEDVKLAARVVTRASYGHGVLEALEAMLAARAG